MNNDLNAGFFARALNLLVLLLLLVAAKGYATTTPLMNQGNPQEPAHPVPESMEDMFNFGEMYETGRGVKKNRKEASYWYRKVADANNLVPWWEVDECDDLYYGINQEKDYKKARECYEKEQSWPLIYMYLNGEGGPVSLEKAAALLNRHDDHYAVLDSLRRIIKDRMKSKNKAFPRIDFCKDAMELRYDNNSYSNCHGYYRLTLAKRVRASIDKAAAEMDEHGNMLAYKTISAFYIYKDMELERLLGSGAGRYNRLFAHGQMEEYDKHFNDLILAMLGDKQINTAGNKSYEVDDNLMTQSYRNSVLNTMDYWIGDIGEVDGANNYKQSAANSQLKWLKYREAISNLASQLADRKEKGFAAKVKSFVTEVRAKDVWRVGAHFVDDSEPEIHFSYDKGLSDVENAICYRLGLVSKPTFLQCITMMKLSSFDADVNFDLRSSLTNWMPKCRKAHKCTYRRDGDFWNYFAPAINCHGAQNAAEYMICSDLDLGILASWADKLYKELPSDDMARLKQEDWIKKRNICQDYSCVENEYKQRIKQLVLTKNGIIKKDIIARQKKKELEMLSFSWQWIKDENKKGGVK